MKFEIMATSGVEGKYLEKLKKYNLETGKFYINIECLDDLISLRNELNEEIIVSDGVIEIYDDYRE